MSEKTHWPFEGDQGPKADRGADKSYELEVERAQAAQQKAIQQRQRHDRFLVGGKAHTRKHGLS